MEQPDVKRLRELMNLTQEQFASKMAVTLRTVQNWEAGKRVPKSKIAMLMSFAEKFPEEHFSVFTAMDSPGAGMGNDVEGISSADLKRILDQMESQRKDYMKQLSKRDAQIDNLIALLQSKK